MCTAIAYKTGGLYFGRTLDNDVAYPMEVTITPRNFPLPFRAMEAYQSHHAIIGMAYVADGYPLYFDAMNEKGLMMAGLNFVGYAAYNAPVEGRDNIAQFELIPWILGRCASVSEAKKLLKTLNLTDTAFSESLPPSQLHWIIADQEETITVEAVKEGLRVYPNPTGVLTNNPPFPEQLFRLNDFMHLTPGTPENNFSDKLSLHPYSRGMGAMGLPGDLSSQSRFVRAAFTMLNSVCGNSEEESVSQFFHILGTVSQTKGCCDVGENSYEMTIYTSCCSADKGIYYYTTYDNHQITAVDMQREDLDGSSLRSYAPILSEQIMRQN